MEESLYSELLKKNIIPIVLGVGGLIFIAIGLITVFSQSSNKSSDLQFQAGSSSKIEPQISSSQGKIVIDIEGAIIKPGIYSLSSDSRMHDLIVASGGLSAQADRDWFAKNLNQAQKLTDGQKVYIPRVGEDISTAASTSVMGITSDSSTLIDINSASLKDLDSLPGIGPVTAQKIVDNRPYSSINDLLSKKVVTSSEFEKIKDKIRAN